ncbi:MAG: (2Fe-2S)-binding protein [Halanaerobium sp.]|nr:(2Fe-2S)-binding protein [Halanaerobium sp.]
MDPKKVIICRCEDITLHEVRELIKMGYHSVDEIKRIARCGMGPCQGNTCRPLILREISHYLNKDVAQMKMPTFRPPTTGVKIKAAAEGDPDEK